jgi:exopolysaccharide biosynthesis polyprenyl glycosylphosphotransferase
MSQTLRREVDADTRRQPDDAQVLSPPERPSPSPDTVHPHAPTLLRPLQPQYRRLALVMALFDIASVAMGTGLAFWLTRDSAMSSSDLLLQVATIPPVVGTVFSGCRLYAIHLLSPAEEFRRLVLAVTLSSVVLIGLPWWPTPLSARLTIVASWALTLILVLATRRVIHLAVWRRRTRGALIARTLVVGTNEEADRLAARLGISAGFVPVGLVATGGNKPEARTGDLPIVGHLSDLSHLVARTAADCVFVATSAVGMDEMRLVSRVARRVQADLRVTARMPEVLSTRLTVQPIDGVIALTLRPVRLTGAQAVIKRLFDITSAGIGLILAAPLSVAIAVAIRLTSRGPVLFRQQLVGKLGAPFTLLTFRTMTLIPGGKTAAVSGSLELTVVGRWLRQWRLDLLPALLNVIKGDMSFVGPRPAHAEEIPSYDDWHFERLEVRPGMTGLWQVNARPDLSFDEGVELDLFYIENWSLAYDMFILAKTISSVLWRGAAGRMEPAGPGAPG